MNVANMVAVKDKVMKFADLLSAKKNWLAQVLPKHVKADRFVKVALAAISKQPDLLECEPNSILLSVMQAGQLGLEPTGVLGSAYLVKYGKQCQLIIGYRGLIDLARRSGQILSIEAHVVYEKDKFACTLGLTPTLTHEPCWDADPGALRFVYAVARLRDGAVQFEVMSKAQVDAIRRQSKAGSSGPWVTHYDEMAKKTVIRRIAKYLPLTVEMQTAVAIDSAADTGELYVDPEVAEVAKGEIADAEIEAEPTEHQSRTDAMKAALMGPPTA